MYCCLALRWFLRVEANSLEETVCDPLRDSASITNLLWELGFEFVRITEVAALCVRIGTSSELIMHPPHVKNKA